MEIIETPIKGLKIIKPKIFKDARGYFFESYNKRDFDERVKKVDFVQDNESFSRYGVVRGMHYQNPPYSQSKLVRCIRGKVIDVALDIRKGSETYGKYFAVELSEENHTQFFIPRGFAHGFAVLSEYALFQYKCDNYYHPEAEAGISITDDSLVINWPLEKDVMIISEKDKNNPLFSEFKTPFILGNNC